MSKRIVFFIATLEKGGAERVVSILSRKMAEEGHYVEILLYMDRKPFYDIDKRVKITSVQHETKSNNIIKNMLFMRKYFKKNADVVISMLASFNILSIIALACSGVPLIVADRSDPRQAPAKPIRRKLRNFLYRYADKVVVQTENNRAYFSKYVQKKCDVIFNLVDLGEKVPGYALNAKKENTIVMTGRLIPAKNYELAVSAFNQIKDEFPDYQLVVYGEGSQRQVLEQMIDDLGLSDRVKLPGSVKDIFDKISTAKLYVLSSDREGMSNALLEAMCVGLPVISTKVSGAPDVIVHEENGLLVDLGNCEQLALAMKRMLSDETFSLKCAKNATRIADKVTSDTIYEQWMETCQRAEGK